MKIRFPIPHTFPTFLNLGLHQQQEPRVTHLKPRSYERKSETVENPSRLALRLTEFILYLWTLINAGSHIAIINNDENSRFSYEDWFEGTNITCYEDAWVPSLWRNPLWKNPLPDLVILLSINPADRFTILRELQDLRLPLLNLTTDDLPGNELSTPIGVNPTSTYFYIKIIRFAVLRWQQTYLALKQESHLPDVSSDFILSSQPLIRWRKKAQRKRPFKKLGLLNRIRSTKTLKKNISLKKKSYITRRLSCRPITQLTEFGKNRSPRVGKRNKKKISMCR